MAVSGECIYHPISAAEECPGDGFSWLAFLFTPIWLLVKGVWGHAAGVIVLSFATAGFAMPIIAIVYGFIGNELHRKSLVSKGYLTRAQWNTSEDDERLTAQTLTAVKQALVDQSPSKPDIVVQLKGLAELRDAGILTEEEFTLQKQRVLS